MLIYLWDLSGLDKKCVCACMYEARARESSVGTI